MNFRSILHWVSHLGASFGLAGPEVGARFRRRHGYGGRVRAIPSVAENVSFSYDVPKRSRVPLHIACPLFLLLALCIAAAGTAHAQGRDTKRDYELLPSDLIRVQVFQEPDLDREVRVSQKGEISLPLIGKIEVQGRTLRQVEELIRELYDRDYLVNPQVNIIVMEYQPRMVNVMGAVNSPGALEFPPEQSITVIDAISRAGGFNRLADRKRVRLTRTYAGGRVENFVINADELMSGASAEPWVVLKGDVIFVPERVL